ncbi:hypothetical protein [Fodinibius sp.]|uniref:hypothetical protein n=1 Tax=Fodinibius sp. TaxID=1872440 RepID=UPI002ACDDB59|nr:hypothetical protein [Fodinibius sp.]MDZ7658788.1 hypothetical protein [Fodinibius sp.]
MKTIKTIFNLTLMAALLGFLGSCDILNNGSEDNQISVTDDLQKLNERVSIVNEPVELDTTSDQTSTAAMAKGNNHTFTHVATVSSPLDGNGEPLSATSIEIRANKIYVSYHRNGNSYAGAIDIIDVKDESNPKITSLVEFTDTDINALEIEEDGKKLWYTGGRDVSKTDYNEETHKGAVVGKLKIDKDVFEDYRKETPLPSYSGNALVDHSQQLYVASGATGGGFFELNKDDLSIINQFNVDFAKYIDWRKDDIIGLSLMNGEKAKFNIMDFKKDDMNGFETNFTVTPANGKNVIEHRAAITYGAFGNQGVKGYKFDGGGDPLVYEFDPQGEDVANAVSAHGNYVYIAHGTDGLIITTQARSPNKEPEGIYSWDNDDEASANFVKAAGKFVILANGTDGLKILKKE